MFIREGKRVALGSPRQQTQKMSEKLYGNSAVDNKRFFLVLSSSFIKAENLNFDWRQKRKFFVFALHSTTSSSELERRFAWRFSTFRISISSFCLPNIIQTFK